MAFSFGTDEGLFLYEAPSDYSAKYAMLYKGALSDAAPTAAADLLTGLRRKESGGLECGGLECAGHCLSRTTP